MQKYNYPSLLSLCRHRIIAIGNFGKAKLKLTKKMYCIR
jgi:hypothetical protein